MAIYYDIPDDAERAIQDTRKAALTRDRALWKEVLVIYLDHNKKWLKLVIDGVIGRDYSSHTVLYRARFDPTNPEMWETQVSELLDRY